MNKNFIQINENYGAVSDETGNINIISKNTTEYNLKDILEKENTLENLKITLNNKKRELHNNKISTICANVLDCLIIGGEIALYNFLHSTISTNLLIIIMATFYTMGKVPSLFAYKTRITRFKERKKANINIIELNKKIDKQKKELYEMKQKVNYKINSQEYSEEEKNSQINKEFQHISTNIKHNNNNIKIKVLRLNEK